MARNPSARTTSDHVLQCIVSFIEERSYPPSLRELADCAGLASVSSVHRWLKVLEDEGRIQRISGTNRAIKIVEEE